MLREKRKHANYKPNRRLDAKSSRGMIYENEELRLRTININAEVERGQSEIKNLKREREMLRKEIWTLRDEYDKLEHLLRVKGIDPDEFRNGFKDSEQQQQHQNEDEESEENSSSEECLCEECCDENCSEKEKTDKVNAQQPNKGKEIVNETEKNNEQSTSLKCNNQEKKSVEKEENTTKSSRAGGGKERLKLNFDHLSIVSEEEPINELTAGNANVNQATTPLSPLSDLSAFLQNVDMLSPLSYLQKLSPPLSHFETIYDKINNDVKAAHGEGSETSNSEKIQPSNSQNNNESEVEKSVSKPKHFFSPIRKKIQPDVFISTVMPSTSTDENSIVITTQPTSSATPSSQSFQTGGNLEELLQDIEALSKDIVELQTNCSELSVEDQAIDEKKKPFRSELNLVLSYPKDLDPSTTEKYNEATVNQSSAILPKVSQSENTSDMSFMPINTNPLIPIFASNNSLFYTTCSAPTTPNPQRKAIDVENKSSLIQASTESNLAGGDKKKQKRVSIINNGEKDEKAGGVDNQKDLKSSESQINHSHIHKGHCHNHSQQKRRMSLDNSVPQNVTKNKNHRQVCSDPKVHRRESNRSNNSFKKRSRSDSTFGGQGDLDQGGTSMSERYSNSIASSRESSTSLSMKSGKRRISITSYGDSKKIPCALVGGTAVFS